MFHIIYLSSATVPFTTADLQKLLATARRYDASRDITGALFYKDGNFLQILEGEEPVVNALFLKIVEDKRHCGIIVPIKENILEREFPDWSMGFKDLTGAAGNAPDGFDNIFNNRSAKIDLSGYTKKVAVFLKMFASF